MGKSKNGKHILYNILLKVSSKSLVKISQSLSGTLQTHPATERNFYASLLMAMGLACPKRDTALFLKERVLNELIIRLLTRHIVKLLYSLMKPGNWVNLIFHG